MDKNQEAATHYANEQCTEFEGDYVTYAVGALKGEIEKAYLAGAKAQKALDLGNTLREPENYNNPLELSARQLIERSIQGSLRATIKSHGPITEKYLSSASKRVFGGLKQLAQQWSEIKLNKYEH